MKLKLIAVFVSLTFAAALGPSCWAADRPNILIITVDDMSADSIGEFGCQLEETTPNIDAFVRDSLKFQHAHVQVGNCMPGRNIMFSGLFSHTNGVEGFRQNKNPDYPVLCDLAQSAGYFAAIRGKVSHSTPYTPYAWDAVLDTAPDGTKHNKKDPASYGASTRDGIEQARAAGKPFCLLINIADPHKPFYGSPKSDPFHPTRVFSADEVPLPGFLDVLAEDSQVLQELASYYSTVRRSDDCFREVMAALDESGQADETFVMFFSDHGMPLPFAKTQLYYHSTHTPLAIRWPGVTQPQTVNRTDVVSAVDFLPTLLDVMQTKHPTPQRLHGRSFIGALRGQSDPPAEHVVLQYNENSGLGRHPMRGIQTQEFLYLFNPWSDGQRRFTTATTGTATYRQMVKRAPAEPPVAARLAMFNHRVVHELYNTANDPDCLNNLADLPEHAQRLAQLQQQLLQTLQRTGDPVAPLLKAPDDVELRQAFMVREDEWSDKAKAERRRKRKQQRAKRNAK